MKVSATQGSEWDEATWAEVTRGLDAVALAVAQTWQRELVRQMPDSRYAVGLVPGVERPNGPELFLFPDDVGSGWDVQPGMARS